MEVRNRIVLAFRTVKGRFFLLTKEPAVISLLLVFQDRRGERR